MPAKLNLTDEERYQRKIELNRQATARYRAKRDKKELMLVRQRRYRGSMTIERKREINRRSNHKRRLRSYGITIEQYNSMWSSQNYCCAICGVNEVKSTKHWHLDHCHSTSKVRGILCQNCNVMLGYARDNPIILQSAIGYLNGR